jgi:hypothetical protein
MGSRTSEEMVELFEVSLATFRLPAVAALARGLLIHPRRHLREWDYGSPGQQFECWLIAELPGGTHGIVYSDDGHTGWGLVRLDYLWFGPDSYWFSEIEDAFVAGGWDGPLPDNYEVH